MFFSFLKNKLLRLVLPAILFGVIYFFLFKNTSFFLGKRFFLDLFNGFGHLWFLIMLFLCFIVIWFLEFHFYIDSRFKRHLLLFFFGVLAILPFPYIYFGITNLFKNMIFFYIGFNIFLFFKGIRVEKKKYFKMFLVLVFLYFIFFALRYYLFNGLFKDESSFINQMGLRLFTLFINIVGVLLLYTFSRYFTAEKEWLPKIFGFISSISFSVFVLHQFVIELFYYHTDLINYFNEALYPWLIFSATVLISFSLSSLFLKFKIYRKILG